MPDAPAAAGSRSSGTTSSALKRKTQQKIVSASGPMNRLLAWKMSFTCASTSSTSHSMKFWNRSGTPVVARRAAA